MDPTLLELNWSSHLIREHLFFFVLRLLHVDVHWREEEVDRVTAEAAGTDQKAYKLQSIKIWNWI